jgi:hypothetical protein
MNIRDVPARVVAEAAETTPDYLRVYRYDGLLEGVGELVGAGYQYSQSECLGIALAVQLAKTALGVKGAFNVVFADPTPDIVAAIAGRGGTVTFWPQRGPTPDRLAVAVKIVVDLGAFVRDAADRLEVALEKERSKTRLGRRLSFGLSPAVSNTRA